MRYFLVTMTTFAVLSFAAFGQQQAPSQNSPSQKEYRTHDPKTMREKAEAQSSQVTLKWEPMPGAVRYDLKISRIADMSSTVHSVSVIQNTYQTPALMPGLYYYQVEGFKYEQSLGKHPVKSFVVGKPLNVTGKREPLDAPQIIAPNHLELFPTHGKVRLAWQAVPGARGYRFRLFEEDKVRENRRWKRDTPPRWVTEVQQPWIEVHDAPYTSYMYLQSGLYRWDVAAIDKDGGYIGDVATGYFRTSRQWHLKPNDFYLRAHYFFTPYMDYKSYSSLSGQGFQEDNAHAIQFRGELDWFFLRHWGVSLGGSYSSLGGRADIPSSADYMSLNLDALFRWYLSIEPRGWTFTGSLGLGLQELPNIDNVTTDASHLHIERPKVLGPRFGFRFYRRWNNPWEMQIMGNYMFPVWWAHDPSGGSSDIKQAINGDLTWRFLYNFNEHFAAGLGLQGEYRKLRYSPSTRHGESSARIQGANIHVTGQFHY